MAMTNGKMHSSIDSERSSAQRFFDDYEIMTKDNEILRSKNTELETTNLSLVSEVNMLREELQRMEKRFAQVQGFAVNLTTRLSVIYDTISVAMKEAAVQKIETAVKETSEKKITRGSTGDLVSKEYLESHPHTFNLPKNSL